jgi:zinc D-Ala-D-Ala dipeptidase
MKIKITFFLLLFIYSFVSAQTISKYGLQITDNLEEYTRQVTLDQRKLLLDLEEFIPGIKLDIRYATENNFMGEKIYKSARAFLRWEAALALSNVQQKLNEKGLELKIFDAYRPYQATVAFYERYKDTNYVASPYKGSRHNRGCAVDLTIVVRETGDELVMPTEYDDFSESAHIDYMDLTPEIIANRQMLIELMESEGFKAYHYEWWHFDFIGWERFEIMDLSFQQLDEANLTLLYKTE